MSRRTAWLRASRFFLIERASILVGNWSRRNWILYLRKLLKILKRIKFSHFTCDLTPSYRRRMSYCGVPGWPKNPKGKLLTDGRSITGMCRVVSSRTQKKKTVTFLQKRDKFLIIRDAPKLGIEFLFWRAKARPSRPENLKKNPHPQLQYFSTLKKSKRSTDEQTDRRTNKRTYG